MLPGDNAPRCARDGAGQRWTGHGVVAVPGGLLAGKRLLVTGVLVESSIAYHVARVAQEQGASVVLTSYGRAMPITSRTFCR